jgi:hypothetical protein
VWVTFQQPLPNRFGLQDPDQYLYAGDRVDLQSFGKPQGAFLSHAVGMQRAFGFLEEGERVLWGACHLLQESGNLVSRPHACLMHPRKPIDGHVC